MQRNLKYLIAICAIALSACSTSQKLASTSGVDDDDVYFTQAKAGDQIVYADNNYQANNGYNNGEENDDYYYYGDYASRINRFNYYSPFSMYNNFYYGYSPYNRFGWGGYGFNMGLGFNYGMGYGYDPFFYGGMYSPYFYDPFYASFYGFGYGLGYGMGYGYSPWGWGGYGYGGYGYGGGFLVGGSGRNNPRPVYAGGTSATSITPGRTTIYQTVPGRRPGDLSTQSITTNGQGIRAVRDTRTRDGAVNRPDVQARPTYNPPPAASPSFGGGGGGGGNSGGGGGGGGRPVRP
jgi:hypothetical protein